MKKVTINKTIITVLIESISKIESCLRSISKSQLKRTISSISSAREKFAVPKKAGSLGTRGSEKTRRYTPI
jgi:hypothetical protein